MGDSRLEKGLRAAAWTALVATLLALIGMGLFLQPPSAGSRDNQVKAAASALEPASAPEENE